MKKIVQGFSKKSKEEKISWLREEFSTNPEDFEEVLKSSWHQDEKIQKVIEGFTENTIANFHLPFDIAPNFLIDGQVYAIPMVVEESSVVAAASAAAKFWLDKGGFHTQIIGTTKVGQVHFKWNGNTALINQLLPEIERQIRHEAQSTMVNMDKRGGGLRKVEIIDWTHELPEVFQLRLYFETCNSMGANFINTVLEQASSTLERFISTSTRIPAEYRDVEIIMSILSNYTPECLVKAWVECPISELGAFPGGMPAAILVKKFKTAVDIARVDTYRAVTHNKGIFNGIDALVIATGNDFRAIEACGHAYAARDGQYRSLSLCSLENDIFRFELEIPLALGTIGGLTQLHPLAKVALEVLGNPSAQDLMRIVATLGLAQNFAAVRSLVTTGIQAGHMRMHLLNILNSQKAAAQEVEKAYQFFADKVVSYSAVSTFLSQLRNPSF